MAYEAAMSGRSPFSIDPVYAPLVGPSLTPFLSDAGLAGLGCPCSGGGADSLRRLAGLGFESSGNAPIDWSNIDLNFGDDPGSDSSMGFDWWQPSAAGSGKSILPMVALAGVVAAVVVYNSGGKKGRRR